MDDPVTALCHVVFAGCPLAQERNWAEVQRLNPTSFEQMRNEVLEKDFVVSLAPILNVLVDRRFGKAGLLGFQDIEEYIDSSESPHVMRILYQPGDRVAPIHNVHIRELGHSGLFLTPGYAAYFWLPVFWRVEPPEYLKFEKLCWTAGKMHNRSHLAKVRVAEEVLAGTQWRWAGGSLRKFIRCEIESRGRQPSDALIALAISGTWRIFGEATAAFHERETPNRVDKLRALNPGIAVTKAVDALPS